MDKESDRMYRYSKVCLQNNGISPAQADMGRASELCWCWGPWPRLGSQVFGRGADSL